MPPDPAVLEKLVRLDERMTSLIDRVVSHLARTDEHGARIRAAESDVKVIKSELETVKGDLKIQREENLKKRIPWPVWAGGFAASGTVGALLMELGSKIKW